MENKELCKLCALKLRYNLTLNEYKHHKGCVSSYEQKMKTTGKKYLGSIDGKPFYSLDDVDHSITEGFLTLHKNGMVSCLNELNKIQAEIDLSEPCL